MWDRCVVIVLSLFPSVLCDDCVTFDFENDFNSSFSNEIGVCLGRLMWNVGRYEDLPIDSPDDGATKFVYPNEVLSCASSFPFNMTTSGVLEVNLFMDPSSGTDQVTILANQIVPGGNDAVVGNAWIIALDENFVSGWITARIAISGFGSFAGYITILGMAARDSIVLVDSFRYISPVINEEDCIIYEKFTTTTKTTQTDDNLSTETESSATVTGNTTPVYTAPPDTTPPLSTPPNTTPPDTTTPNTIPPDITAPDTTTPNTIPPDITPPDTTTADTTTPNTIPPDIAPPDTTTPDTTPPDTIPSETTPPDTTLNDRTPPNTTPSITMTTTINPETTAYPGTTDSATTQTFEIDDSTIYSGSTTEITQTTNAGTTTVGESESISTAEDIGTETVQTNSPIDFTTSDSTTDLDNAVTTERPAVNPDNRFWNAYTITMVIFLCLIILLLTAIVWYLIGKRRKRRLSQTDLSYFEEYPTPIIIPRVTKVRTYSRTINKLSSIFKTE